MKRVLEVQPGNTGLVRMSVSLFCMHNFENSHINMNSFKCCSFYDLCMRHFKYLELKCYGITFIYL
jgi:hypothetical protein